MIDIESAMAKGVWRDPYAELEPGQSSLYNVLNEIEVVNQPTPTFLIDGLIPENATCLLTGQKGMYKSFFAIDAALTMTHGLGWFHGHKTRKGGAIYIASEGAGGLGKRVKAWRRYHKLDLKTDPSPFWLIREPIRLLVEDDITKIIRTVKHMEREYSVEFISMWFDTVSRGLAGAKEDEESWGKVMDHGHRIKEEIGHTMSFIGIAHQGKDHKRGVRGSSVAEGSADNILSLHADDKEDRPDEFDLHVTKLKDDEDGQTFNFVTCSVPWLDSTTGKEVSSLVLLKEDAETEGQRTARLANRAERITPKIKSTKSTKPTRDKKAELIAKIADVEVGEYTLSKLCEQMGGSRGSDKYDAIREVLPENDTKTLIDSKGVTKSIIRTIRGSELVKIS